MEVDFNGFRRHLTDDYNKLIRVLKSTNEIDGMHNLESVKKHLDSVGRKIALLNCMEAKNGDGDFDVMPNDIEVDIF